VAVPDPSFDADEGRRSGVRRRRLLRTLPAAVVAGLAGCLGGGGVDGNGDTPTATSRPSRPTDTATPSPTGTPTTTDTPTATPEPTDSPTPSGTPTATPTPTPAADLTVTVGPEGRLVFDPETFEVAAGGTVRWEWASPGHNVSPASRPSGASWPGEDGATYGAGHTYAYTFSVPGTYEYHCDPHQSIGMTGSFTVR
jgi:plastocyanin